MEQERITVGFHYIDEFGNEYSQESKRETYPDQGYDDLDVIGEQLDAFLSQCGFMRNGYRMFMESLTDDEFEELALCLDEYREQKKKEQSDEDNNKS